jgi:hypothetical protein
MPSIEVFDAIGSIAAAIIALVGLFLVIPQARAAVHQLKQIKTEQIRQRRVNIVVARDEDHLVVLNKGPVHARNVQYLVDGKQATEHRVVPSNFPLPTNLYQDVPVRIPLSRIHGSPPEIQFEVIWDDEFVTNSRESFVVPLFA